MDDLDIRGCTERKNNSHQSGAGIAADWCRDKNNKADFLMVVLILRESAPPDRKPTPEKAKSRKGIENE